MILYSPIRQRNWTYTSQFISLAFILFPPCQRLTNSSYLPTTAWLRGQHATRQTVCGHKENVTVILLYSTTNSGDGKSLELWEGCVGDAAIWESYGRSSKVVLWLVELNLHKNYNIRQFYLDDTTKFPQNLLNDLRVITNRHSSLLSNHLYSMLSVPKVVLKFFFKFLRDCVKGIHVCLSETHKTGRNESPSGNL